MLLRPIAHHKYTSILRLRVDHLGDQLARGGHSCCEDLAAPSCAVLVKLEWKMRIHAVVTWLSLMSESRR